jgi:hypothetical protein
MENEMRDGKIVLQVTKVCQIAGLVKWSRRCGRRLDVLSSEHAELIDLIQI